MNTTSASIPKKGVTSIRIDLSLLEELKSKAKAENRSLSNYLETLLHRFGFGKAGEDYGWEPDEKTLKDIEQAEKEFKEGKCHTMLEGESMDDMLKRLGYE